ncbi:MAG TPA: HigA family addiction module antitoxin [Myxococcota bacterium]|nr:HigA family addiction module antitoxin [Myxococcota bacterium]
MEHPGITLKEKFFQPLGLTNYAVAKAIHVPQTRLSQITRGKRRISADTARRLGVFFGVPARWFLQLQLEYDLHVLGELVIDEPIALFQHPDALIMPSGVRLLEPERRRRPPGPRLVEVPRRLAAQLEAESEAIGPRKRREVHEVRYPNGMRGLVGVDDV